MIKRLTGTIQPYAWGSRTMIPELLGLPPTGEPQAGLWLGAHPMAPSLAEGERLDQLIGREPGGCHRCEAVRRLRTTAAVPDEDHCRGSTTVHCRRIPPVQAEAGFAEEEQRAFLPTPRIGLTETLGPPEVLCARTH